MYNIFYSLCMLSSANMFSQPDGPLLVTCRFCSCRFGNLQAYRCKMTLHFNRFYWMPMITKESKEDFTNLCSCVLFHPWIIPTWRKLRFSTRRKQKKNLEMTIRRTSLGGNIYRHLARLKLHPGCFMLSVYVSIGFGRTMLQLYCGVLNASHNMFLSNGSKWPRVFTAWHVQTQED